MDWSFEQYLVCGIAAVLAIVVVWVQVLLAKTGRTY